MVAEFLQRVRRNQSKPLHAPLTREQTLRRLREDMAILDEQHAEMRQTRGR